MKIGKLPEPMLIRSVLKEVKHRREEILVGPAVGQDCAVFEPKEGDVLVFSTDPITGTVKDIGSHSVHITANDLAASGAEPIGIMLTMLLTPETREEELKEMMRGVESACSQLNMEDGVFPTIYTEKKDGVQPEFDIRTDRFEVAIDAIDKINQSTANQIAKNKGETEAVKDFGTGVKTDPEKS